MGWKAASVTCRIRTNKALPVDETGLRSQLRFAQLFIHHQFYHVVENLFVLVPVWHFAVEDPEERRSVVVVDQVSQFVDDHIVHGNPPQK